MLPIDIEKKFPQQWRNDDEEGGKNLSEEEFFRAQLKTLGKGDLRVSYVAGVASASAAAGREREGECSHSHGCCPNPSGGGALHPLPPCKAAER